MKARCSKDPKHDRFMTVAHVTEDWIVDEEGNFLDTYGYDQEIIAPPHPDNTWICIYCGEEAIVTV